MPVWPPTIGKRLLLPILLAVVLAVGIGVVVFLVVLPIKRDRLRDHLEAAPVVFYAQLASADTWNHTLTYVTGRYAMPPLPSFMPEAHVQELAIFRQGNAYHWVTRAHGAGSDDPTTIQDIASSGAAIPYMADQGRALTTLPPYAGMQDRSLIVIDPTSISGSTALDMIVRALLSDPTSVRITWQDMHTPSVTLWHATQNAPTVSMAAQKLPTGARCAVGGTDMASALARIRTRLDAREPALSAGLLGITRAWWIRHIGAVDPETTFLPLLTTTGTIAAYESGSGTTMRIAGTMTGTEVPLLRALQATTRARQLREIPLGKGQVRRDIAPAMSSGSDALHTTLADGTPLIALHRGHAVVLATREELLHATDATPPVIGTWYGMCDLSWFQETLGALVPFLLTDGSMLLPLPELLEHGQVAFGITPRAETTTIDLQFSGLSAAKRGAEALSSSGTLR